MAQEARLLDAGCVEVPFEVQKPQAGSRVDAFLAARLHRYSRAEVQRLIAAGRVWLRGRPAKAASRVAAGEIVLIRYPRRPEPPPAAERLAVVYEDGRLLAVNKPAGMLSHPTDKVLRNAVTSVLKTQRPELRLHLLHRLDRETSGALLLAKSREAARELAASFIRRDIRKEYLVLATGKVPWKSKTADAALGREGGAIKVRQAAGFGQEARTEFERLDASEKGSLLRARPLTGRLHQIRVHLASLGHPVIGDKLYTGDGEHYMKAVRRELAESDLAELGARRQMLHAWRLRLAGLEIAAPPPEDFAAEAALRGLRLPS